MDAVTYPHGGVERRLNESFVAARIHIGENQDLARKFFAVWTPGLLFLDGRENIHYRAYGFHPPEDFEHLLHVGHGMTLLDQNQVDAARGVFERAALDAERSALQAEALYWTGVCRHKSGEKEGMGESWKRILDLYPDSPWAHKVEFIRPRAAAA
jgi:hypothetical protein